MDAEDKQWFEEQVRSLGERITRLEQSIERYEPRALAGEPGEARKRTRVAISRMLDLEKPAEFGTLCL